MAGIDSEQHQARVVQHDEKGSQDDKPQDAARESPKTSREVTDDTGDVKVSYDVEEDEPHKDGPSAFQKLKDTLRPAKKHEDNSSGSGGNQQSEPEIDYELAAAGTPAQNKLPNVANGMFRMSAGGSQENSSQATKPRVFEGSLPDENIQRTDSEKKTLRGEELGTGYEPDSEGST